MDLFLYPPEIESRIRDIRKVVRLSMNGVVAERMTEADLGYRRNYGLSLPRIREIAGSHAPDVVLALRLWQLGERETMLLATMLFPPDCFTLDLAEQWLAATDNIELSR